MLSLLFALHLSAGNASAQVEIVPLELAPAAGIPFSALEPEAPLPALPPGRALLAAAEGELPSAPLPPAAQPAATNAGRVDPLAGALEIYGKLLNRETLGQGERAGLQALVDRAGARAFDAGLPQDQRLEAVTFLAQTALLSYHDLASHRLAEDWLVRLKFSLARIHYEAEDAWCTVNRHLHQTIPPESRRFMYESLLRSTLLHP
jgi:hypothetical protein